MYMDLHYVGSPQTVKGGTRRRRQYGGNATFEVLDHVVALGLDSDEFQTACRAGWETVANLGRGAFGYVDLIRVNMPAGPHEYVMKTLHICPNSERNARQEFDIHKYMLDTQTDEPTDILTEAIIPAIALAKSITAGATNYHIFFEKEDGTSLYNFIRGLKRSGEMISVEEYNEIEESLNDALHSIHTAGIVHRDIKPANLFIITDADPNAAIKYRIKLIDFGLAIRLDAGLKKPGVGTPSYFSDRHKRAIENYKIAVRSGVYDPANPAHNYKYTKNDDEYAANKTTDEIDKYVGYDPSSSSGSSTYTTETTTSTVTATPVTTSNSYTNMNGIHAAMNPGAVLPPVPPGNVRHIAGGRSLKNKRKRSTRRTRRYRR